MQLKFCQSNLLAVLISLLWNMPLKPWEVYISINQSFIQFCWNESNFFQQFVNIQLQWLILIILFLYLSWLLNYLPDNPMCVFEWYILILNIDLEYVLNHQNDIEEKNLNAGMYINLGIIILFNLVFQWLHKKG